MNLDLEHVQAGRDVKVQVYLVNRGPVAHQAYLQGPQGAWDSRIGSRETVEDLRTKLLYGTHQPKRPVALTVTGTLFPCALLSSGWWEKHVPAGKTQRVAWRDEVQRWLFYGFDLWGPSWDFTWQFDDANARPDRPYYIAQLGDGDEANSLPVLLPAEKARRYQEFIGAQQGSERWGGLEAEVTGVLGHRKHFTGALAPGALELFGGLLDYCLWLDADTKDHRIMPLSRQTDIYSGYLWKCVAPAACGQSDPVAQRRVLPLGTHEFCQPGRGAVQLGGARAQGRVRAPQIRGPRPGPQILVARAGHAALGLAADLWHAARSTRGRVLSGTRLVDSHASRAPLMRRKRLAHCGLGEAATGRHSQRRPYRVHECRRHAETQGGRARGGGTTRGRHRTRPLVEGDACPGYLWVHGRTVHGRHEGGPPTIRTSI